MTLHIYRPDNVKRTCRICPYHKKLEYATMSEYYDTSYINFDCGTRVDTGEGVYEPPKKYKRLLIYWDGERFEYVLMARYVRQRLYSHSNLNKVRRIAKERLKTDGIIKENIKE